MTTYMKDLRHDNGNAELLRLRRERHRERRRRQLDAFYRSVNDQITDKVVFLFDQDMNIA